MALAILATASPLPAEEQPATSVETKYLKNIRQVTSGMVKAGEGYFSPDGKQIIYQSATLPDSNVKTAAKPSNWSDFL